MQYPVDRDIDLSNVRVPPHSIESEQSILGALLLENGAWDRIADLLAESDFYRYDHRIIYHSITQLIQASRPADVITVFEALSRIDKADVVGGLSYLNALAQNTPSAANICHYAEIVHERGILRKLLTAIDEIGAQVYKPQGRNAKQILDDAEIKILSIAEQGARTEQHIKQLSPVLTDVVERIDKLYNREDKSAVSGLPTGFTDLDNLTTGLQPGELIIVAGRPSMGKTAFAINIAENAALAVGANVLVFSMEMAAEQLGSRMLGSIGKIDQQRLRSGQLLDEDWPRLTHAVQKLHELPFYIDDSSGISVADVRSRARRLARQCGKLDLIVIDYLQLMASNNDDNSENRATEISEITRNLKGLARELKCPVIALSQLNRELEKRGNKRPIMSDLRESGAIEQDADVILFIYRDQVYSPDSLDKGTAEIIIGKQRSGPIGTVRLTFLEPYTKFDNYGGAQNLRF